MNAKNGIRKIHVFAGTRVSEVKVNSNIEGEWLWFVRNCNPADLGTRSAAIPRDLAQGSECQEVMAWMKELWNHGHVRSHSALHQRKR